MAAMRRNVNIKLFVHDNQITADQGQLRRRRVRHVTKNVPSA